MFARDVVLDWGCFESTGIPGVKFLSGKCSVAYCVFSDSHIKYCYIDKNCDFSFEEYSSKTPYGTFYDCEDLTTLIIPETVTHIPEPLVNGCKLVTIFTPEGSAADKYAKKQFVSVNNAEYDLKVKEYQ